MKKMTVFIYRAANFVFLDVIQNPDNENFMAVPFLVETTLTKITNLILWHHLLESLD